MLYQTKRKHEVQERKEVKGIPGYWSRGVSQNKRFVADLDSKHRTGRLKTPGDNTLRRVQGREVEGYE